MLSVILRLIAALVEVMFPPRAGIVASPYEQVKAAVGRWDARRGPDGLPLAGDDKYQGVFDELNTIGVHVAKYEANLLIELAVTELRRLQESAT